MQVALRSILVCGLMLVVYSGVASAQEATAPALTVEQQVMVQLNDEAERVFNDLKTALEQIANLQTQVNVLTIANYVLRLSVIRERSTPKVEGYVFDWQIEADTGQRVGLKPIPVINPEDP